MVKRVIGFLIVFHSPFQVMLPVKEIVMVVLEEDSVMIDL
jgi:hypothetical protein